MDGHIWIESDGLEQGTTATFIARLGIPEKSHEDYSYHHQRSVSPPFRQTEPSRPVDLKGVRVLVTDDNCVNRMVTRELLSRIGCTVTVVGSGRECLALMGQPNHGFRVLLLDVCMPDMDGYEVATRIKERFPRHKRPLMVALTANTDNGTRERCLEVGMDGVLSKPMSVDDMRCVLQNLLETGLVPENQGSRQP
ncbi:hypothetical protein CBR_g20397 [Chara braunii]|uniref:Response regulatory domain-containing protein n=1 Tax=Chara braunii TaxID=69332 RepID=A0A388JU82_CHABU|nr:hypothetical protein CBR_g20397 [Chara braunii]|eukprot:GBG61364.1 hypothetical protein CBR_g20397 [Chara braunii]